MSLGGNLPYHLRQNKAIDRSLFIDLLSRISRYRNISDYTYIGFGGPFLEDFKYLHSSLRIKSMISLESDKNVAARQHFNQPLSCIKILNQSSSDFLVSHDFTNPYIVWFDYAVPRDLPTQLAETQKLVGSLTAGDVFKITVNASPETLGRPSPNDDLREYRARCAKERLAEFGPSAIGLDDVSTANYPRLLLHAIFSAAKRGVESDKRLYVQPLSAFAYKDGQQMLTATAILLNHNDKQPFFAATRLDHWPYKNMEWSIPLPISIPDMSAKERLYVESLLPDSKPNEIIATMGYFVGTDAEEAAVLMKNFADYYRLSPWFSRVQM